MHLTLGFFGDVDPVIEEKLREKLAAIQWSAFFLPLIGLGTFPAKGWPKIIWIGVGTGHPHLFQLHKRVQDAAVSVGLEGDLKPWHPHVTLRALPRCFSGIGPPVSQSECGIRRWDGPRRIIRSLFKQTHARRSDPCARIGR